MHVALSTLHIILKVYMSILRSFRNPCEEIMEHNLNYQQLHGNPTSQFVRAN